MSRTLKRTDFLAACQSADSRNRALEEIREKGAEVILAIFRMMKNSLVHAIDNDAVGKTVHESHAILLDFANTVGGQVSVTFVDDTIFVCGQLLRASRSIYESAQEVGDMLNIVEVSEFSYTGDVLPQDLLDFCKVFSVSARDPNQRQLLVNTKLNNINLRQVDSELSSSSEQKGLASTERALHSYASSLVVIRQFLEKISVGRSVLPHRVKRVAQRLVALTDADEGAMLAMTSLANAHRDDSGRAVQTTILALLVGRKLTRNRGDLCQLAMAALMADVGRVRVAGKDGLDRFVPIGDQAESAVPALTSSLFIATGGVNIHNALRTVIAYESSHLERLKLVGPPYSGTMSPLFQSRVLHVARSLLDRLAPRDGSRPLSPLDGLASLAGERDIDQTAYKLLVQAVGLLPTGTVVEFETGEWGVVIGPSATPQAVSKPRIKIVTDRSGQVLNKPTLIDLGTPSQGRRYPAITGVIDPGRARFNVAAMLLDTKTAVAS